MAIAGYNDFEFAVADFEFAVADFANAAAGFVTVPMHGTYSEDAAALVVQGGVRRRVLNARPRQRTGARRQRQVDGAGPSSALPLAAALHRDGRAGGGRRRDAVQPAAAAAAGRVVVVGGAG